jgi:hypothetical protein
VHASGLAIIARNIFYFLLLFLLFLLLRLFLLRLFLLRLFLLRLCLDVVLLPAAASCKMY